jgi:hypothetical protein
MLRQFIIGPGAVSDSLVGTEWGGSPLTFWSQATLARGLIGRCSLRGLPSSFNFSYGHGTAMPGLED